MRVAAVVAGLVSLTIALTVLPAMSEPGRLFTARRAALILTGNAPPNTDFAADYVGSRRLLDGRDPYPVLGDAFAGEGIDWGLKHRNPHPPSAFLLTMPVAALRYEAAVMWWGWLQMALMVAAAVALGVPAWAAIAASPVLLLWPPTAESVGQTTAIWLLAGALAWKLPGRWAGLAAGVATLPKGAGALFIWPAARRDRAAVPAFVATGVVVVLVLVVFDPGVFGSWLDAALGEVDVQVPRWDNGAPLAWAARLAGPMGVAAVAVVCVSVAVFVARFDDWAAAAWLAVALLPAGWIYSLVPLILAVRSKRAATALVVLPLLVPAYTTRAAAAVAAAIGIVGLDLAWRARLSHYDEPQPHHAPAPRSGPPARPTSHSVSTIPRVGRGCVGSEPSE